MKKYISTLIIFILGSLLISILDSCTHESEVINELPEICFESEVLPIFQNSCGVSNCHDQKTAKNGYIYNNYDNIIKGVNPGNAMSSKTYLSLIDYRSGNIMPPDKPLTLEERSLIRLWIEQGAKNSTYTDSLTDPADTSSWTNPRACFNRDILPILQSSCAFSGCHDQISQAGERILTDYTNTYKYLRPGDPEESNIYQKLIEDDADDIMPPPPYDPLPKDQIDSIYNWIFYGALNENCGTFCDTSQIGFNTKVWPIISQSCTSCHSGTDPSGSIKLENYSDVASISGNNLLINVLKADGAPLMPPDFKLSDCKIRQIEIWLKNGYKND